MQGLYPTDIDPVDAVNVGDIFVQYVVMYTPTWVLLILLKVNQSYL